MWEEIKSQSLCKMTQWILKAGHLSRPPQAVGEQPTSSWVGTNGCHSNLIQIVCKLVHMYFVIIQSSINLLLLLSWVKLIVMDYSHKVNLLGYYFLWVVCGLLRFEQPNWVDVHFLRKEAVLISSQFFMLKLQNPCYSTLMLIYQICCIWSGQALSCWSGVRTMQFH